MCEHSLLMISLQDWQCVFSEACFVPAGPGQAVEIPEAFPCKFTFQSSVFYSFSQFFLILLSKKSLFWQGGHTVFPMICRDCGDTYKDLPFGLKPI